MSTRLSSEERKDLTDKFIKHNINPEASWIVSKQDAIQKEKRSVQEENILHKLLKINNIGMSKEGNNIGRSPKEDQGRNNKNTRNRGMM